MQFTKDYLADSAKLEFNEIAWTLQAGRHPFRYRRAFVASSAAQAREILSDPNSGRVRVGVAEGREREFLFLFPGQGSQYLNMGRGLTMRLQYFGRRWTRAASY